MTPPTGLRAVFDGTRAQGRAALVGYLPAGFPTVDGSADTLRVMIDGGCDLVEVGIPFSDPVLDGPVIQHATETARAQGFRVADTMTVVERVASGGGAAVVMSYFNPILAYGVDAFARDLAAAGGLGVITPDLIVDEAEAWLAACAQHGLDPVFLVAPSSSAERISLTAAASRGFLYAASTMGITGARDQVSAAAPDLVARCRELTALPIGVGLGVRTGAQASEIAGYADAVIVGSAFVSAAGQDRAAVDALARELADGVAGGSNRAAAQPGAGQREAIGPGSTQREATGPRSTQREAIQSGSSQRGPAEERTAVGGPAPVPS